MDAHALMESEEKRAWNRQRVVAYRNRMKAEGKCIACGTPVTEYRKCGRCRRRARDLRARRTKAGLCTLCCTPTKAYVLCTPCRIKRAAEQKVKYWKDKDEQATGHQQPQA